MKNVQESTSTPSKRLSTLKCLGELSEYHSYVIQPYKNHKGLLQLLINCLQIDKDNQDINEKTLQVLGRFGALDPFQCEEILSGSLDRKHRYEVDQKSGDR